MMLAFFVKFECEKALVGVKYAVRDLICDVMNCCVWSSDIIVDDKILKLRKTVYK